MALPLDYQSKESPDSGVVWHSWARRWMLLLAMILIPVAGVLLYVGPAWAAVVYRLITDVPMIIIWLGGATGLGLFVLRKTRLCGDETSGILAGVTAAATGLGLISLTVLVSGLAGALNAYTSWAIVIAGWILGGISLRSDLGERGLSKLKAWLAEPAGCHWLWMLTAPFLLLALAAAMAPPGMLWTPEEPHGYDVVEYHLQVPREWYEARRIIPLHHNVFSYFPFNVEMHYLLAMHLRGGPWAAMYQTQLMHLAFIALTILAVYGFASQHTQRLYALIAALSLLTVPWLTQLASIAYDEGGLLLFGTLAIGWAMLGTFAPNRRPGHFLLAGAMAGFAAGSKLTAVPEVLVAIPALCALAAIGMFSRGQSRAARDVVRGIVIFAVGSLVCFSPWLVRNVIWAHNPVFPEMMPLLGSNHFTPTQVERFELAHKPPPEQQPPEARLERFIREILLGWQFGYLLLPVGFIAGVAAVAGGHRRGESLFLLGLLLILAIFWITMTHLQGRFFILAAPIAALLVAQIDWRDFALAGLMLVVLFVLFAGIGWSRINNKLYSRLYGSNGGTPMVQILGIEGKDLYAAMMGDFSPTASVYLVGDARAFLYTIPMTRLRYRTVFDVGDDPDFIKAWAPRVGTPTDDDWLLIDQAELARFQRTYYGLPAIPLDIQQANVPIIKMRY